MIGVIKTFKQPLKLQIFQLLMILSSWWSSEPLMTLASGDQLLSRCFWWRQLLMIFRTTCLHNFLSSEPLFFRCYKLPSCWFHCSHLFFHNLCLIKTLKILSMVSYTWTNISISNWHFLIPCYHQNSKGNGNVKHILCDKSPPFWWWQTLVFKMFNCC